MSPPVAVGYLVKVSRLLFDGTFFSTIAGYYGRLEKMFTRTKKKVSTRIVQLSLCMQIRN